MKGLYVKTGVQIILENFKEDGIFEFPTHHLERVRWDRLWWALYVIDIELNTIYWTWTFYLSILYLINLLISLWINEKNIFRSDVLYTQTLGRMEHVQTLR